MITKAYRLICDECYRDQIVAAENIHEAKAEAKAIGWKPGHGRTAYCSALCATLASLRRMSEIEQEEQARRGRKK